MINTLTKDSVIITDREDCDVLYEQDSNEYKTCYAIYILIINSVLLSDKGGQSIIGNITDIENSIFGTLSGYSFTSESNCYLVNPGIALVNITNVNYLKLTNKGKSFISINSNNKNFITIDTNRRCDMKRDKMYNINNYDLSCSFSPIVVRQDGLATIGSGDTQIAISSTGEVKFRLHV